MKWFNQKAEIKRLQGQVKHLQGELNISNHELGHISNCYFAEKKYRKEDRKLYLDAHYESSKWKKSALKALAENEKLNNQISLSKIMIDQRLKSASDWKVSALKTLVENNSLKNGIQECIDYETPKANATVRRITNKLRGLL